MISDDELKALIKGASREDGFEKFSNKELEFILNTIREYPNDKELSVAAVKVKAEILKRRKFILLIAYIKKKKWHVVGILCVLVFFNFAVRYEKEQVGSILIKHDRLLSRVEVKSVFNESGGWKPVRLKNMKQARAYYQRLDIENAVNGSQRDLEEIKDKLDEIEREREHDRLWGK